MKKERISRRDFLKATIFGIGAGFFAACKQVVKPVANAVATFTATPSKTNTPTPAKTNTPTATPTDTKTPTLTQIPDFRLLYPENGAKLPAIGKVIFSWEPMPGAVRYQLQFTLPSGQVISFDTEGTSKTRFIESFLAGGVYTWQVIAFDTDNTVICISELFAFEKDAYTPSQGDGGSGGNKPTPPGHSESGNGT